MKIKILFISLCLIAMCLLLGCSKQAENNPQNGEDVIIDFEAAEADKAIEEFKREYNAVDFPSTEDMFSVDIIDTYKDKNLFAEMYYIDDVFYIEDDMYMYSEQLYENDYHLLLKITPEQYAKIKTFGKVTSPDDYLVYFNSTLCAVFSLDNIETEFSALNAWFGFNLDAKSTIADYDLYDSYNTKIVKGTLIDIVEIEA